MRERARGCQKREKERETYRERDRQAEREGERDERNRERQRERGAVRIDRAETILQPIEEIEPRLSDSDRLM